MRERKTVRVVPIWRCDRTHGSVLNQQGNSPKQTTSHDNTVTRHAAAFASEKLAKEPEKSGTSCSFTENVANLRLVISNVIKWHRTKGPQRRPSDNGSIAMSKQIPRSCRVRKKFHLFPKKQHEPRNSQQSVQNSWFSSSRRPLSEQAFLRNFRSWTCFAKRTATVRTSLLYSSIKFINWTIMVTFLRRRLLPEISAHLFRRTHIPWVKWETKIGLLTFEQSKTRNARELENYRARLNKKTLLNLNGYGYLVCLSCTSFPSCSSSSQHVLDTREIVRSYVEVPSLQFRFEAASTVTELVTRPSQSFHLLEIISIILQLVWHQNWDLRQFSFKWTSGIPKNEHWRNICKQRKNGAAKSKCTTIHEQQINQWSKSNNQTHREQNNDLNLTQCKFTSIKKNKEHHSHECLQSILIHSSIFLRPPSWEIL